MNRRQFSIGSLCSAALLQGCRPADKPAHDATLFHNNDVRSAISELEQAMNGLDMQFGRANDENCRDVMASLQTAAIRLRGDLEELKRSLGYQEAG